MKRETPRQKAARFKSNWERALADGRVLKYEDGLTYKSFPTLEARDRALYEAQVTGIQVEILHKPNPKLTAPAWAFRPVRPAIATSPYLNKPLRTLDQAKRDTNRRKQRHE